MVDPSLVLQLLEYAAKILAKGLKYKSTRKTLRSIMNELVPVVEQIEHLVEEMGGPTEEIRKMKCMITVAQECCRKCSEIRWSTFYLAPYYQYKISEARKSLEGYISSQVLMYVARDIKMIQRGQIDMAREMKMIQRGQIDMAREMKMIQRDLKGKLTLSLNDSPNTQIISPEGSNDNREPTLELPEFVVGLDGTFASNLKFKLLNVGGPRVLNLSGLAGSGKTTLAKKLCLDQQVKEKFRNNIVFHTMGSQNQGNEHAANQLQDRLSKFGNNPVLLVLDDVWPDSKHLVEQLRVQISSDSKIMVTSRFEIKEFGMPFPMEPLSKIDAEALLLRSAPNEIVRSCNDGDEDICEILHQIIEGCQCLPSALEFIGRKLHGKPIVFWKKMAKEWSQGQSILDSHTELLTRLQNSLHVLEDESMNERFMDLGLFPENKDIPVSAFIDMWIELYNLDDDIHAMTLIYQLTDMNSVDIIARREVGSIVDEYYNNHFLKQHGLFRALAIRLSSQETFENRKRMVIDIIENNIPKWWPQQQPRHEITARILSITTDQKITPSWCDIQAAEAEVLVLNLLTKEYDFPEFMKTMRKLKVLIVMNYGFHPTELKNLELLVSLLSLKRIRFQQISIPYFCELKNVRKLSLYTCEVQRAFENCCILISEALSNLVELNIDYCKDLVKLPAGLCDINTLTKLSISNCHSITELPQEIGKLKNLELLRVSRCASFEGVPPSIAGLERLSFLDVSDCVNLTELPEGIVHLKNVRKLYIMKSSIKRLPDSFMDLKNLKAVICDEDTYAAWGEEHPKLKKMTIDSSLDWLL
ncbi:putative disease resistance protein At5g47280 isoform X1 [Prosopis cineraria]|uniref:putative disease resistance protein At5g47280 isoform X1 n=1 Tax=Prosopis cineraria TaxID=364024 RepID=UPI00240F84A4|nr:putative disease resistance protein At5g47280 isoform X1 [Prosopis cineraria]